MLCLLFVLLSESCKQKQESQVADYTVSKIEQPLSDKDIASCFKALDLHFERFACVFPERTRVTFSSIEYIKGQERGGKSTGTTYVDKGQQNFILFLKEDSDQIEFTLASSTGSVGCGRASVAGYHSKTWGWLPVKKLTQDKQPVFLYAANNEGISGFSTPLKDIEAEIAKYDFVMVIYASIGNEE
jgi:hypothetical protein